MPLRQRSADDGRAVHDATDGTPPGLADQLQALTAWRAAGAARHGVPAGEREELGRLLEGGALPAVVTVHDLSRRAELEQALAGRGLTIRGADAVGAVALVVVDADGPQAVRAARASWPTALVAAQVVADEERAPLLLTAGAAAVFSRQVPPGQVADSLVACWRGDRRAVLLL